MEISKGEEKAEREKLLEKFDRINGKLTQLIMSSIHKFQTARKQIQAYEDEIWAFDILADLIKRFTPKTEAKLEELVARFGQLQMVHRELFQTFTDIVTK